MCLIIYGLLVGDKDFIESIGLIGVWEMYNFFGVLVFGMVELICCLKEVSFFLFDEEDVKEIVFYFDYII